MQLTQGRHTFEYILTPIIDRYIYIRFQIK